MSKIKIPLIFSLLILASCDYLVGLIELKDNKQPILREIARKWGEAEDCFSVDGGQRVARMASDRQEAAKFKDTKKPQKKRSSLFGFLKK